MSHIRSLLPYCFLVSYLFILSSCSSPVGEHHPEWEKYFNNHHVTGCIEIYDLENARFIDYNADRCAQRFIPASTFKIFNSLVALESKTIPDTSYVIKWDGIERPIATWNHDQSMSEAFRNSTVWYYQEVAKRIGPVKMQQYLNLLHYGNGTMGNTIDSFWLNGELRISCDEQIEFLKDVYTYQLPLSARSIDLVKGMMLVEKKPGYTLSGKTGWGKMKDVDGKKINVGWWVGYVETGNATFLFATNIESPDPAPEDFAAARKDITNEILQIVLKEIN